MRLDSRRFRQGVRVGGAATGVLLAFLYTVAAPTSYFRARIPFLLGSGGIGPFLFVLMVFQCAAVIGMGLTGARSLSAVGGASLAALACTIAVSTGAAARFVPQVPESGFRWVVFGVLALVSLALLTRERRISRMRALVDPTRI